MISVAAVLHNLLIDAGDDEDFGIEGAKREDSTPLPVANAFNVGAMQTRAEREFAILKRNAYMYRFFEHDNS